MATISSLIARMEAARADLDRRADLGVHFMDVYLGMTRGIAHELETRALGGFDDPAWVERWDLAFAGLYLDALDAWQRGHPAPRPWQVAFDAAADRTLIPLRHVLLSMNAHMNYDLPQSLLAVVDDDDFANPALLVRRGRDHDHINRVILSQIGPTDDALAAAKGGKTLYERIKTPLERLATGRFTNEARVKAWTNATVMAAARARGNTAEYERLRAELASRCAAKVDQLARAREVVFQLWIRGFGVQLERA